MAPQYRFFRIPVQSTEKWEEDMNRFLRSVRVVHVQREFVDQGENSFWAMAIEYMQMVPQFNSRRFAQAGQSRLQSAAVCR